ncbi:hypothetical protein ACQR3P_29400 [Rhodococcus sp. IEGM1300]
MRNLIEQGILYYHKELLVERPSVLIRFDEETGDVAEVKDELPPLTVKGSYTIDDLYAYLSKRSELMPYNKKQDIKALETLVEYFDIDMVLFMVDEMWEDKRHGETRIYAAMHIDRYVEEAKSVLKQKKNNFRMANYFQ